ncbi:Mitochondrial chaperone Frataxin [Perkinsus olseni]|nr:Mitochondrial chaperone Frataxin [Perkinsus olseni]
MASRAVVARFFSTEMHHGSVTPPDAIEMDGDEYDAQADDVLDSLFDAVDQACEKDGSKISSVDLHDGGVLEVETDNGQTFVINKHEASKLLWYSSPVSGPGYFAPEMKDGRKWWSEALNASVFDQFSRDLREMGSTALPKFRSAEGQQ